MSKGIHRPGMKSPFEAKRVIVSSCAAIAMVLGAMSAGATVSGSHEPTASRAEVSSIVTANPVKRNAPSSVTTTLTKKQTIAGRDFFQQPVTTLYSAPDNTTKPVKTAVTAVFGTLTQPLLTQIGQIQTSANDTKNDKAAPENTISDQQPASEAPKEETTTPAEPTEPTPTTPTEPTTNTTPEATPLGTLSSPGTTPTTE